MTSAIAAEQLTVSLGGPPVLHAVDFAVDRGTAAGLFGGNGSGKTTLIRALLGLLKPDRGTGLLYGTPVNRFAEWSRIGYVPQRNSVQLDGATVGEVVGSGRLARRRPFRPASRADRQATAAALTQVGIGDLRDRPFTQLSGGQQQRTLIARALAGHPELLILDEPLAGLDVPNQERLAETLATLHKSGHTVFTVLHEAGPLGPMLRRRLVLDAGYLVIDESC